jgi:hypothetical protein
VAVYKLLLLLFFNYLLNKLANIFSAFFKLTNNHKNLLFYFLFFSSVIIWGLLSLEHPTTAGVVKGALLPRSCKPIVVVGTLEK